MKPLLWAGIVITTLWSTLLFSAESILLKNVHLLDPNVATDRVVNLILSGGKIKSINAAISKTFIGQTLDLTGKWIIPGLIDMHDHSTFNNPGPNRVVQNLTTEEVAKLMLYCGVTSFVDLFADEGSIFASREKIKKVPDRSAKLYAAGPMLTCSEGHGTEFGFPTRTMDTPKAAERQVSDLISKRKPDIIKIAYDHAREYRSLDKITMEAIVRTAKKNHLRTIVHIGTWKDAIEAATAGADIVTHLHESEMPDSVVETFKKFKTWEVPTMTYQTDLLHLVEDRSLLQSALLREVITKPLLEAYLHIDLTDPYVDKILKLQVSGRDSFPRSLKKLDDQKIPLMVGTDSGDLGVFQGFSVHREMALWVKAGLTPWEALKGATTLPKKFWHQDSGIGLGETADLVVLNQSPLSDITNTQDIALVFHNGKNVDRPTLLVEAGVVPKVAK